ncbi:MAG: DUF1284 domain-containing protein [Eubacteriales bacterium]|nr:DUF1284 domain-containing protein [Eubacteriales bacterium]MCI7570451.1 DUF1284 domain-containing protein [Clostridiales bacterium]MDD7550664.1 DUF1284 domain-containing protein [Clostridia bacterium]MDY5754120.1 DUF1284 domain-containing protein [Eubacteriales bacterium]
MQKAVIELRAHHILCLSLFEGKGYDDEFAANMQALLDNIGACQVIFVVGKPDTVCSRCPNRSGDDCLFGNDDVKNKDIAALDGLGLCEGVPYTTEHLNESLRAITREAFDNCCATCRWYACGVCKYEKIHAL